MHIKTMDRDAVRLIASRIESELQNLANELGIDIARGRGTYRDGSLSLKLEISLITETGEVLTKEAQDFKSMATLYGLQSEDLGREFTNSSGDRCVITGLKRRASRYPITYRCLSNGKQFKTTADSIVSYLSRGA